MIQHAISFRLCQDREAYPLRADLTEHGNVRVGTHGAEREDRAGLLCDGDDFAGARLNADHLAIFQAEKYLLRGRQLMNGANDGRADTAQRPGWQDWARRTAARLAQ